MINAGALWLDKDVVVDDNLITSRKPDDLPMFCKTILSLAERMKH
jgi:protease I